MKHLFWIFLLLFPCTIFAQDLELSAGSAILVENSTGKILYEKNSSEKLKPASMTKIMTLLITMENLESGKISFDDEVFISNNAASMGGSQVFLDANSKVRFEDLLKSVVIASANDSAVAISEHIAGTTDAFVNMMNNRAKELGCKNTNFVNVHGLEDSNHYTTAYDMSLMARELIKHDKIFNYTTIYEEYFNKPDGSSIWMVNTNKLIKYYNGLDGLKTGYTADAGYCLTSTAKRGDMRLISVVMKEDTSQIRNEDTIKLLDYGFSNYKIKSILTVKDVVGKINIFNAKKEINSVVLKNDATSLETINENNNYTYNVMLDEVKAPIKKGDVVGKLDIIGNGKVIKTIDVTVKEDILKANIWDLFKRNINNILVGK